MANETVAKQSAIVPVAQYPEHEKMSKIQDESQAIGAFLESCGYQLGEWRESESRGGDDVFMPIHKRTNQVLAEYFEIDLDVLEQEKRAMLDSLRMVKVPPPVPPPLSVDVGDYTCHLHCGDDSHSGRAWHTHEGDPCPLHPDAPVIG